MKYTVNITRQAKLDITGIHEYISCQLMSPLNASNWLEHIEKRIMGLGIMPNRHRLYDFCQWDKKGMRIMPCGRFVVLYIADSKTKTVSIIRVMYGGRDIPKQLNWDLELK